MIKHKAIDRRRLLELLEDDIALLDAMRAGVHGALTVHFKLGRTIPFWENGEVVWRQVREDDLSQDDSQTPQK